MFNAIWSSSEAYRVRMVKFSFRNREGRPTTVLSGLRTPGTIPRAEYCVYERDRISFRSRPWTLQLSVLDKIATVSLPSLNGQRWTVIRSEFDSVNFGYVVFLRDGGTLTTDETNSPRRHLTTQYILCWLSSFSKVRTSDKRKQSERYISKTIFDSA